MNKIKWILVVLNILIILGLVNYNIYQKEKQLKEGKLILLKLVPVDPRSLMQGDYMQLSYEIAENSYEENMPKRGYCVVRCDSANIATFARLQPNLEPQNPGDYCIPYTKQSDNSISIGASSYFFEEGSADKFENAAYGALKVDQKGHSLLIGLCNPTGQLIALPAEALAKEGTMNYELRGKN